MKRGSCGINRVGGYCPNGAQTQDPLCRAHAAYASYLSLPHPNQEAKDAMLNLRDRLLDLGASIPGEMEEGEMEEGSVL